MPPDAAQPLRIDLVPPAQQQQALGLVLDRGPQSQRQQPASLASSAAEEDGGVLPGLVGAYRGGELVGAALAEVQAGRAASVWPPRLVCGEPAATAAALLAELSRRLAAADVRVAQSLLESERASDEKVLCEGGFQRLSELLYLVSPDSAFPTSPPVTP